MGQAHTFLFGQFERMDQAQAVDHAVGKLGRDQFVAQLVGEDLLAEILLQRCREGFDQHWLQRLVADPVGGLYCVLQNQLG